MFYALLNAKGTFKNVEYWYCWRTSTLKSWGDFVIVMADIDKCVDNPGPYRKTYYSKHLSPDPDPKHNHNFQCIQTIFAQSEDFPSRSRAYESPDPLPSSPNFTHPTKITHPIDSCVLYCTGMESPFCQLVTIRNGKVFWSNRAIWWMEWSSREDTWQGQRRRVNGISVVFWTPTMASIAITLS